MKFTFDMKDMALNIEQWTRLANDCQCRHDDTTDALEGKRTKLCNLQDIIKKAISNVIADCNNLLSSFPMSLATYNDEVYPDIKTGTIVAKCLSFMNEAYNISQRREFEQDTAEKQAERAGRMQAVQDLQKQENELVVLMTVGKAEVEMYGTNGIHARYIEVSDTPAYKLLREIEKSNVDNKDITLYYQAVCLYVALEDERQYIELKLQTEETTRGGTPKEGGGGGLPSEEKTPNQQKKALPPELDTPEAKVYFDKAIELKVMDANYNWLLGKELCSCFGREMSHKLGLSKKKTADGKVYVSWKPFETLFGYKNLRGNLSDIEKKGINPKGIETINEIFGL